MPLIILVLVVVVIVISTKEGRQSNSRLDAYVREGMRKTNARLEQKLISKYLILGCSFDEAYEKAAMELEAKGFVVCTSPGRYNQPKGRYKMIGEHKSISYETSIMARGYAFELHELNSNVVKTRFEILETQWRLTHPDEPIPEFPDEIVYAKYPTSEVQYGDEFKRASKLIGIYPVGSIIYIPNDGEYKILEIIDGDKRILEEYPRLIFNLYKVKNLRTGEITQKPTFTKGIRKL